MTTTTTIPADAIRIATVRTEDWASRADLATRQTIATARPELANTMRVGELRVAIDPPAEGFDSDTMIDTRTAYVEWREHSDALQPHTVVATIVTCPIAQIEAEIARLRDHGVIPGYIAAAALADLR